jgi:hypothetical protein
MKPTQLFWKRYREDHYKLRGRKYDEAVEVLTEAIERSGVLLA